jgi:hypothetical protein
MYYIAGLTSLKSVKPTQSMELRRMSMKTSHQVGRAAAEVRVHTVGAADNEPEGVL